MPAKKKIEINGEEQRVKQEHIMQFQERVEKLHSKGHTYIESIMEICEHENIEFETIKNLISSSLYEKLYNEAGENNLLNEKSESLPI